MKQFLKNCETPQTEQQKLVIQVDQSSGIQDQLQAEREEDTNMDTKKTAEHRALQVPHHFCLIYTSFFGIQNSIMSFINKHVSFFYISYTVLQLHVKIYYYIIQRSTRKNRPQYIIAVIQVVFFYVSRQHTKINAQSKNTRSNKYKNIAG